MHDEVPNLMKERGLTVDTELNMNPGYFEQKETRCFGGEQSWSLHSVCVGKTSMMDKVQCNPNVAMSRTEVDRRTDHDTSAIHVNWYWHQWNAASDVHSSGENLEDLESIGMTCCWLN